VDCLYLIYKLKGVEKKLKVSRSQISSLKNVLREFEKKMLETELHKDFESRAQNFSVKPKENIG